VRGLRALLEVRPWTVHIAVSDGYWQRAKLKHFVQGMNGVVGRTVYLGSVEWTDPSADPEPFIELLRDRMVEGLAELRGERSREPAPDGAREPGSA